MRIIVTITEVLYECMGNVASMSFCFRDVAKHLCILPIFTYLHLSNLIMFYTNHFMLGIVIIYLIVSWYLLLLVLLLSIKLIFNAYPTFLSVDSILLH